MLKSVHFWIIIAAITPILQQLAEKKITWIAALAAIIVALTGLHATAIKNAAQKANNLTLRK